MKKKRGQSKGYLDNLWSKRVKEEAGYRCELCGSTEGLNSHHIHHRSNHSVRWWIPNGCCLCSKHHLQDSLSAHKNPAWFWKKIRTLRGEKWYEDLIARTAQCFPWKKNLDRIKAYLKNEIEDYLDEV